MPSLRSPIRRIPADLFAILIFTLLMDVLVFVPSPVFAPIRTVFGIIFVVFVPGYVVSTALFPRVNRDDRPSELNTITHEILSPVQRGTLSVAFSVAVVSLVGLVLNYTPWSIRLTPIMVVLNAVILLGFGISYYRRRSPGHELVVPSISVIPAVFPTGNSWDTRMNALLVVSFVVLAGTFTFALVVPSPADSYSEFYLVTADEDGGVIAAEYPSEITVDGSSELVVGVTNHEHRRINYTIVVQLQVVDRSENEPIAIYELDQFNRSVSHNDTWQRPHEITTPFLGEDLRLQYLLYRGDPPKNPTRETAYRVTHIWITVTDGSETE